MKRKFTCILIAIVMLVMIPQQIFAHDFSNEGIITPRWTYITKLVSILSDTGSIEAGASVNGSYDIELIAEIQEKDGFSWDTVETWTETTNISVSIEDDYPLDYGVDYRLKVSVKIYNSSGKVIETASKYSSTVTG